jgi:hypothetical protein
MASTPARTGDAVAMAQADYERAKKTYQRYAAKKGNDPWERIRLAEAAKRARSGYEDALAREKKKKEKEKETKPTEVRSKTTTTARRREKTETQNARQPAAHRASRAAKDGREAKATTRGRSSSPSSRKGPSLHASRRSESGGDTRKRAPGEGDRIRSAAPSVRRFAAMLLMAGGAEGRREVEAEMRATDSSMPALVRDYIRRAARSAASACSPITPLRDDAERRKKIGALLRGLTGESPDDEGPNEPTREVADGPTDEEREARACWRLSRLLLREEEEEEGGGATQPLPPVLTYQAIETLPALRWAWLEYARSKLDRIAGCDASIALVVGRTVGRSASSTVRSATLRGDPSGFPLAYETTSDPGSEAEALASARVNALVRARVSPNFSLLYYECRGDGCDEQGGCEGFGGSRVIVSEFAQGTLLDLLGDRGSAADVRKRTRLVLSIIIQLLLAIVAMSTARMAHNDLYLGNVMWSRIEPVWLAFEFAGRRVAVPTMGVLPKVAGFANATARWMPEGHQHGQPWGGGLARFSAERPLHVTRMRMPRYGRDVFSVMHEFARMRGGISPDAAVVVGRGLARVAERVDFRRTRTADPASPSRAEGLQRLVAELLFDEADGIYTLGRRLFGANPIGAAVEFDIDAAEAEAMQPPSSQQRG